MSFELPDYFYRLSPDARISFIKERPFNILLPEALKSGVEKILAQYPLDTHPETIQQAVQARIDASIALNTTPQEIYVPVPEQSGDKLAHLFQGLSKKQFHKGYPDDVTSEQIHAAYQEAVILAGELTAQYLRTAGLDDRAKPLESYFSDLVLFGRG